MQESKITQVVQELFQTSKFQKCIEEVNDFNLSDPKLDFITYQTIELYKCLSYFELCKYQQAKKCINSLIEKSFQIKGERVDEIDLIIQIFNQQYTNDENQYYAIQNNKNLFELVQKYQQQNENQVNYNKGVYEFGLGMYKFIESLDQLDKDMDWINLLKSSYNTVTSFKQEIGYCLACMYYYAGLYNEQLAQCKQLYEENPNYPSLASVLGLAYNYIDKFEEAEQYYKISLQLCPENSCNFTNIAYFYNKQKKYDKEQENYQKAYQINPESSLVCRQYSMFLFENNQKEEGFKVLINGVNNNQEDFELHDQLARRVSENENEEKGIQILNDFISKNPKNENAYFSLGSKYMEMILYDEAKQNLQKCVDLCKRFNFCFQAAKYHLALSLYNCQQFKESLEEFFQQINYSKTCCYKAEVMENIYFILEESETIQQQTKLKVIDDLYGPIQMKLQHLIERISKQIIIKQCLNEKQDIFRQILLQLAYKQFIQQQLNYQNDMSHWDLFIN